MKLHGKMITLESKCFLTIITWFVAHYHEYFYNRNFYCTLLYKHESALIVVVYYIIDEILFFFIITIKPINQIFSSRLVVEGLRTITDTNVLIVEPLQQVLYLNLTVNHLK